MSRTTFTFSSFFNLSIYWLVLQSKKNILLSLYKKNRNINIKGNNNTRKIYITDKWLSIIKMANCKCIIKLLSLLFVSYLSFLFVFILKSIICINNANLFKARLYQHISAYYFIVCKFMYINCCTYVIVYKCLHKCSIYFNLLSSRRFLSALFMSIGNSIFYNFN